MIRAVAAAAIRAANGRASGINDSGASAITCGRATEPSASALPPSRAAQVSLIGKSCDTSGPVRSLADILEPEHGNLYDCNRQQP